jgi:hypothetical protein
MPPYVPNRSALAKNIINGRLFSAQFSLKSGEFAMILACFKLRV